MVIGRLARIFYAGIIALVATVATVSVAYAQYAVSYGSMIPTPQAVIPENQSVLQRPHPDYGALGIRAGSFLIYPTADLTEAWDSNIYATPTDNDSDMVTTFSPAVSVASDWNNHALNLLIADQSQWYWTHRTENVTNITATAEGRFDIERNVYLSGGGGYQLSHEQRGSPNAAVSGLHPTEFHVVDGNLGFTRNVGIIGLQVNSAVDSYSYNNNVTNTDAQIPEQYRDYIQYAVTPQLTYEIVPGYSAFIKVPLNERQYVGQDPLGFNHSSHGYEGDIGAALALGHVINGNIYASYFEQDYEDRALGGNASGPGGGGDLLWNITDLTSFRFAASRTVQEEAAGLPDTSSGAFLPSSSYTETTGKVSVEHELLRNVLLTASGTYFIDEFNGSGVTRSDNNYNAYVGARYLMNRVLSLNLDANYWHRDSTTPGINYDREIIGLRLHFQL